MSKACRSARAAAFWSATTSRSTPTYEFNVVLLQNIVGYVPGLEWPHELEISIDGERVFTAPVGGEEDNKLSDTNLAQTERRSTSACGRASRSKPARTPSA